MTTHRLDKVIALDNLMLKAKFVDGNIRYYDVKQLLALSPQPTVDGKPMYEPLRDPRLFNKVYVDYNGVIAAWNTEIDVDGDEIWYNGVPAKKTDTWTAEDDKRCNEMPAHLNYVAPVPNLRKSEIACFDEIVVRIFPSDKQPNIVVTYRDYEAAIDIATGDIVDGSFPPTGVMIVNEWLEENRNAVQEIWDTGELKILPPPTVS